MATAEELLAGESVVDKTLVIDNDLRRISIPSSIPYLGVESDNDVMRLKFKLPRYIGNIDLSTFSIRVNYVNAEGESDVYTVSDATTSTDYIHFSWLVGPTATKYKGTTRFNLCLVALSPDGEYVEREFNTAVATMEVLEGLETDESLVEEYSDLIEQWRKELFDTTSSTNPDIHAEYFQITDEGVVSLKPEYRGATNKADYVNDVSDMGVGLAGSLSAELPKHIVIPEIVGEKAVVSLAPAIFRYNHTLESVTLPSIISTLPDFCFDNCWYLRNVYNTVNIKSIGGGAFQKTNVVRLNFPNLEQIGEAPFNYCTQLVYVDIGKVEALTYLAFNDCFKLNMIKSEKAITEVGKKGCYRTHNLKHADFSGLQSAGDLALIRSGVDLDQTLNTSGFGTNATYLQYSPTDYWSACTFTDCKNELPTYLCQSDERWADRQIGNSTITSNGVTNPQTYNANGCGFFCLMHIYCGLHNLSLSTVEEMEEIINSIDPNWLNDFSGTASKIEGLGERLGLEVDVCSSLNQANLQTLYDALADGKYAILSYEEAGVSKHVAVVYGINAKGELLVADSTNADRLNGKREPLKYALPIYKLRGQASATGYPLYIVSKN